MESLLTWFDRRFVQLNTDWRQLLEAIDPEHLYQDSGNRASAGECLVRSAAEVEKTFGGINSNLWDDPFEWTLPETLDTPGKLIQYFSEVEATRGHAFARFKADEDLLKKIMTPAGETQLLTLLLDTLVRAGHYHVDAKQALAESNRRQAAGSGSF